MAVFSKVLSGGGGNYRLDLTVNQSSQSIPNNTSVVSWSLVIYKTAGSGYWSYNTASWNVNIGGQTRSGTISGYDFTKYSSLTLGSGSVTINHNADGSKSISNSGYFSGDIGSGTASGNLTLSTIPRASSIGTISGNTIGSAVTVAINRASSAFTHKVWYRMPNQSWQLISSNATTSVTFTPPISDSSYFPNSVSGTMEIAVQTMNGSTNIGSELRKNHTVNVPSSVVPSFSSITHSEYVANVANKAGAYVQRVSRLNMAITGATGSYGSTIKSYRITFAGQTLNSQSGVTQIIASSGTLTATGTITDSRGRTATKSVSIYVYPYDFPKINSVKFERCNSNGTVNPIGTYVKVTLSASVSSLLVSGTQKNSLKYTIQSKQRGTSSYTTKIAQQLTTISYSGNSVVATYSIDYAFDFNVLVNDIFNTTTSIGVISTGKVTMQWGEDWVSVGKTHERGTIDAIGQIYQNDGSPVLSYNGPMPNGNLSDLNYLQSLKQGFYISNDNPNLLNKPVGYALVTVNKTTVGSGGDGVIQWFGYTDGNTWRRGWNHSNIYAWRLYLDDKNTADYVVEQGSNYVKWNSGRMESWGSSSITTPINAVYGSGYYAGTRPNQKFPIAFVGNPNLQVTMIDNFALNGVPYELSNTGFNVLYLYSFTKVDTSVARHFHWHAVGRWK